MSVVSISSPNLDRCLPKRVVCLGLWWYLYSVAIDRSIYILSLYWIIIMAIQNKRLAHTINVMYVLFFFSLSYSWVTLYLNENGNIITNNVLTSMHTDIYNLANQQSLSLCTSSRICKAQMGANGIKITFKRWANIYIFKYFFFFNTIAFFFLL